MRRQPAVRRGATGRRRSGRPGARGADRRRVRGDGAGGGGQPGAAAAGVIPEAGFSCCIGWATMTPRWWAAAALVGLLVALAVVTAVRVPWAAPPAPRVDQVAALHELPASAVSQGKAFKAALRPGTYGAMAVGLIVALLLGLTPIGAALVRLGGRPF